MAKTATEDSAGEQVQKCTVCGEVLDTKEYTLSPEEIKAQYKEKCTAYSYKTIARDPDSYIGTYGKYTGEIIQVQEDGNDCVLRVNITKGKYVYSDTILVVYERKEGEPRLLEDDIVTIYGKNAGTTSYESVLGATITLPAVYAEYIEIT